MTTFNQVLTSEDSFKQIDLLYEIYQLERQKDLLLKELNKVVKLIKNSSNNNISAKLRALKKIIDEVDKKKECITSKLHESFNFFQIYHKVKELNIYILNINKALKKKEIDANTHRLTKEYYQKDIKIYMENLHKLKKIVKEYVIILKNEELQIKAEERFSKSNKLNIINNEFHEKTELVRFIGFLNKIILKNNLKG